MVVWLGSDCIWYTKWLQPKWLNNWGAIDHKYTKWPAFEGFRATKLFHTRNKHCSSSFCSEATRTCTNSCRKFRYKWNSWWKKEEKTMVRGWGLGAHCCCAEMWWRELGKYFKRGLQGGQNCLTAISGVFTSPRLTREHCLVLWCTFIVLCFILISSHQAMCLYLFYGTVW